MANEITVEKGFTHLTWCKCVQIAKKICLIRQRKILVINTFLKQRINLTINGLFTRTSLTLRQMISQKQQEKACRLGFICSKRVINSKTYTP